MNREMVFPCEARVSDTAISAYDPRGARHWGRIFVSQTSPEGRAVKPDRRMSRGVKRRLSKLAPLPYRLA
jgi:hypothetical protein